jgi:hypothetical protein
MIYLDPDSRNAVLTMQDSIVSNCSAKVCCCYCAANATIYYCYFYYHHCCCHYIDNFITPAAATSVSAAVLPM